ncbi:tripartite motif-containing protein 2-like [Tigriopus californicus]|uniref:tripartite motif-containing protein 2-like n=1 Tax=Tigriopus californicus TaxID=6832 RepID=UPI0027DA47B5|nr:tripartite motif-containing protein 2-like [Tigriopus californicus]
MLLALYLQTQHQAYPRLLSPGSGTISSRYGPWGQAPTSSNQRNDLLAASNSANSGGLPGSMASTPEDEDSGTGSTTHSQESNVIKHIDRNILSCLICQQRFREPKVLPCLHTFCLGCLFVYLPPESLSITCPLCGHQSILPQQGVKALQDNYFISHLIDVLIQDGPSNENPSKQTPSLTEDPDCNTISSSYDLEYSESVDLESLSSHHKGESKLNSVDYEACGHQHQVTDNSSEATYSTPGARTLLCSNHSGSLLGVYCYSCETAICTLCASIEHRGHWTVAMAEAIEDEKETLRKLIDDAYVQVPLLKSALANIETLSSNLKEERVTTSQEVAKAFDQLVALVESRREVILRDLAMKEKSKQETLDRQKDEIETSLADLYTSCEFVEKALTHGSETEILLVKKQVGDRLVEYSQMQVVQEPAENRYLVFQPGLVDTFESQMNQWSQVLTSSAIHYRTGVVGEGCKLAQVDRTTTITLTTRDWQGNVVPGPEVEQFFCEIVPISINNPTNRPIQLTTEITDMGDGTYELAYSVPVEGRFELSVKMFDQHVNKSPFQISAVIPPPEEMCSIHLRKYPAPKKQRSKSHYQRPSSARSINDSQCSRNNPIEDDLILKIGGRGRGRGEFTNPQGVAVSTNGRILVADSNNQCIQCFGPQGEVRLKFGIRGRTPGQLQRPTGICCLPNGNYAIADYDNKWVSVFDQTGKFINKIGTGKLLGKHSTTQPCFLSELVALLWFLRRLLYVPQVFDSEGEFMFCFGSNGEGNGQFNAPTGVATDKQDNILVADWGNSRIQVFDSQGSFLAFVNTLACPLYGPQGVAVTPDGNIVVADSGNHCFKLYRYLQ